MALTRKDIKDAAIRIAPYIHRTPVLTSAAIDQKVEARLFFKCENFQKVGAFKMRGAANFVFSLPEEKRKAGFSCHSSGNHGQAVARAAQVAGVPAYVVMPKNSNPVKVEAVRNYGGEVIFCEPGDQARQQTCDEVTQSTGAVFVHPFDDERIIAGQGTAALELIQEVEELDHIICPIGGGGLCAGTVLSSRFFGREISVYGSEPENVNDAYLSFHKGEVDPGDPKFTLADGLRTCIGQSNFEIISSGVKDILLVSEKEMVDAMKLIWERMKIIIEPSCAVPMAAILRNPEVFTASRTGVILTGGNVDLSQLPF